MHDHSSSSARRRLLGALALLPLAARAQSAAPAVEVYKSASCGCCKDWVKHLQDNGFSTIKVHDVGNNAARARLGMPAKFGSCHTATVDGYVLEGHVPAADIRRLLRERPAALGLAVPDMPIGSPGMDAPDYGNRRDPYDVLLIARDGSATVFASYHRAART
jgi:hypothetical protein